MTNFSTADVVRRLLKIDLTECEWLVIDASKPDRRMNNGTTRHTSRRKTMPYGTLFDAERSDGSSELGSVCEFIVTDNCIDDLLDAFDNDNQGAFVEASSPSARLTIATPESLERRLMRIFVEMMEAEIKRKKFGRNNIQDFKPIDDLAWNCATYWLCIGLRKLSDHVDIRLSSFDGATFIPRYERARFCPAEILLLALLETAALARERFLRDRDDALRLARIRRAA